MSRPTTARRWRVELDSSSPEGIGPVLDGFAAFARERRLPMRVRRDVHLILDELVSNILAHSPPRRRPYRIVVDAILHRGELELTISDDAPSFDPLAAPATREMAAGVEGLPIGGKGVLLVQGLVDAIEYRRREGRNEIRLRKKTRPSSGRLTSRGGRTRRA